MYVEITDQFSFMRNCPPIPPSSQHFAVSVDVNLGEGYVGSFPETYN